MQMDTKKDKLQVLSDQTPGLYLDQLHYFSELDEESKVDFV
jgi:hypothetical protein